MGLSSKREGSMDSKMCSIACLLSNSCAAINTLLRYTASPWYPTVIVPNAMMKMLMQRNAASHGVSASLLKASAPHVHMIAMTIFTQNLYLTMHGAVHLCRGGEGGVSRGRAAQATSLDVARRRGGWWGEGVGMGTTFVLDDPCMRKQVGARIQTECRQTQMRGEKDEEEGQREGFYKAY